MEVYVARGSETEVRAYDGERRVADVGRLLRSRHPGRPRRRRDGRQPAGIRLGRLARPGGDRGRPGATPGTTPATPRRTPTSSWPCPTACRAGGAGPLGRRCHRDADGGQDRPGPRARAGHPGGRPPGPPGRRRPTTATGGRRWRWPRPRGSGPRPGGPRPSSRSMPSPATAPTARPAPGFSVGRAPGGPRPRRGRWPTPCSAPTRLLGRPEGPVGAVHRRLRPPGGLHPALGGVVGPVGRGRGQGPVVLRRPDRRVGGQRRRHPGRRPDRPPGLRRVDLRRRGSGLPAQRADLRRRAAQVRLRHRVGPPGPDAARPARPCGAVSPARPSAGCRALVLSPGTKGADDILAAVGDGLYVQSVTGVHSGVNPVSGDFSVGAEGLMIRDGALAEPVREVTVASTLQRMLQSVVEIGGRPAVAPRRRRPVRRWPSATCSSAGTRGPGRACGAVSWSAQLAAGRGRLRLLGTGRVAGGADEAWSRPDVELRAVRLGGRRVGLAVARCRAVSPTTPTRLRLDSSEAGPLVLCPRVGLVEAAALEDDSRRPRRPCAAGHRTRGTRSGGRR